MKTVKFNRAAYEREFRQLHGSYERYALPIFRNALTKHLKAVAKQIRENGNAVLFQFGVDPAVMQAAYLKVYEYVGVAHAEFQYRWIEKAAGKKSIAFFSDLWRKAMVLFYGQYGALRVVEVDQTTINDIQKLLVEAAERGLTQSEQATFIADSLDNPEYTRMRAMRIARTESTTAANRGAQLAAEGSDYQCGKVWIPVVDKRTRRGHRDMKDKEAIGLYDSFEVPDVKGGVDLMQYPGDPTAPASQLVNCFLPNEITSINEAVIKNAFRNRYVGQVITIQTAGGKKFTCTPNHPILTSQGWVKAGLLTESHNLVESSILNSISLKLHVNDRKSTFKKVYDSLAEKFMSMRKIGALVDFYGDIPTGDVDIVNTEIKLRDRGKPCFKQRINTIAFVFPNLFKSGHFHFSALGVRRYKKLCWHISNSLICFFAHFFSLARRCLSHPVVHAFAPVSLGNTGFIKPVNDDAPTTVKFHSQRFNATSIVVSEYNIINWKRYSFRLLSKFFSLFFGKTRLSYLLSIGKTSNYSGFNDYTPNPLNPHLEAICNAFQANPGLVKFDNVISAEFHNYDGFVYTFETDIQMYDINGLIAKNCRCCQATVPLVDGNGLPILK